MGTPLFTYTTKSARQVHDDYLRTMQTGLILVGGVPTPNVSPGSDEDLRAWAIGNEVSVGQANCTIQADNLMPDTASGANLDRWGALLGMSRRNATGSIGVVTINLSVATTTIVAGAQLKDSQGLRYQVSTGGTYANGAAVPVAAIDTGSNTNHANGDTLTWISAPFGGAPTAVCGVPGGTTGLQFGGDSEVGQDEPWRQRILAALSSPPKGGNWLQVAQWAVASSPYVNLCCVYPALNGPSTVYFAVSASPQVVPPFNSSSKSRVLPATTVSNLILPYVQGLLPEGQYCQGLSTVDQPVDIALLLNLPSATTASPPGPGGGWLDGTPWPASIGGTTPVTITTAFTSASFQVNATSAPYVGAHIAWISPLTWTIYNATVLTVAGSSGAWNITIDTPMPGIAAGNYLFPQSVNQQTYVTAIFSAFAQMGPGEWTTNSGALQRGFRHPAPAQSNPYSLNAAFLQQVIRSAPEVQNALFLYQSAVTPTVPANLTIGPNVFTPRNIALLQA